MQDDCDSDLVARLIRKDPEAWKELVNRHGRVLRGIARRCPGVRGGADADDVLQDLYVKVLEQLPLFRGECSLRNWLAEIAKNLGLDRQRHEECEAAPRLVPEEDLDSFLAPPPAASNSLRHCTGEILFTVMQCPTHHN